MQYCNIYQFLVYDENYKFKLMKENQKKNHNEK